MEAISNGAACVGVLAKDGVVIATQKVVVSKLLAPPKSSEKIYKIDEHVICAVAGAWTPLNGRRTPLCRGGWPPMGWEGGSNADSTLPACI